MIEAAQAVFSVPPFPGATPFPVARPSARTTGTSSVAPAALIAALRDQGIGGMFWQQGAVAPMSADDPQALVAAIRGQTLTLQGDGRYAALSGQAPGTPPTEAALEMLVARDLLDGVDYCSPFTGEPIEPLALATIFGDWKTLIARNRNIAAAFGFARWKQDTVEPLLWGGAGSPFRAAQDGALDQLPENAAVAVWKARVPADFLARLEAGPWRVIEVEDGFIRSTGLGADCVPPLSIVLDDLGVHYDPSRPNRLEALLAADALTASDIARAQALRDWIVREGVSKYGVGSAAALPRPAPGRKHVLVVGQVEDDRSVQFGGGEVQSNLELLRRVRAIEPDAYLVYRPHPDVEAGHRRGIIPPRVALDIADAVEPKAAISALIDMVDEVHVITSLAGFEALMRGKAVTTHGTPFFAGWGLTRDLAPTPPRRGAARTLDQLVAATLLRYPLYLDPVTNLPCPPEIMITRLLTGNRRRNGALVPLRQFFGWMKRATAQFLDKR